MMIYEQELVYFLNAAVYSILSLIKCFNIKLDEICHYVVEHKEAGSLINNSFLALVDQIKDRSKDFIHPLHVACPRVKFGINKEYSSHVVVPIGFLLFLFAWQPELYYFRALSIDHLISLLSSAVGKWNENWFGFLREEREVRLCPACVFLNLLPKIIVFFVLTPLGVVFIHNERIILIFCFR